jgi:transcription elongation factor
MLTCLGRVAIQRIASATSSAVSGSATPAYTASAFSWSPP